MIAGKAAALTNDRFEHAQRTRSVSGAEERDSPFVLPEPVSRAIRVREPDHAGDSENAQKSNGRERM